MKPAMQDTQIFVVHEGEISSLDVAETNEFYTLDRYMADFVIVRAADEAHALRIAQKVDDETNRILWNQAPRSVMMMRKIKDLKIRIASMDSTAHIVPLVRKAIRQQKNLWVFAQ